ncbi:hypothetical protein [Limnochorda pilosa]|uniref:hypothetical protein n=1 Tax=Limnochorda pilosa TaxID=1555112 RepID=UPI00082F3C1B|nr:hypothetical protein [Limnochorda pilosa]
MTVVLAVATVAVVTWGPLGSAPGQGVPAAPNRGAVEAEVEAFEVLWASAEGIEPERPLYRLRLRILESRPAPGYDLDPLASWVGRQVDVYSVEPLDLSLFGGRVTAEVTLRGDERSRRFWLFSVRVVNPGPLMEAGS